MAGKLGSVDGIDGTVTVTVLLPLLVDVDVDGVAVLLGADDVVDVAGGATVWVTVEVEVEVDAGEDVEEDVELEVVDAGDARTPQAARVCASPPTMRALPRVPRRSSAVKAAEVVTSLAAPSGRTSRSGNSPVAGVASRLEPRRISPADVKSPLHVPSA